MGEREKRAFRGRIVFGARLALAGAGGADVDDSSAVRVGGGERRAVDGEETCGLEGGEHVDGHRPHEACGVVVGEGREVDAGRAVDYHVDVAAGGGYLAEASGEGFGVGDVDGAEACSALLGEGGSAGAVGVEDVDFRTFGPEGFHYFGTYKSGAAGYYRADAGELSASLSRRRGARRTCGAGRNPSGPQVFHTSFKIVVGHSGVSRRGGFPVFWRSGRPIRLGL